MHNNVLISSSAGDTIRDSVLLAKKLNAGIEISRIPLYKNRNLSLQDTIDILNADLEGFTGIKTDGTLLSTNQDPQKQKDLNLLMQFDLSVIQYN